MSEISVGDVIAGWKVREKLGAGAMGEVFLADHPRLPRADVLKVINGVFAADETYRRRFLREAEVVCTLEHPHVVAVRDRGEFRDRLYIAMQHIDGGDLRSWMEGRGRLPLRQVALITEQVASALDAAHEHGLVHRDVKPENILVKRTTGGEPYVYLADFGISRVDSNSTQLTVQGDVLATPSYAAPELISGMGGDGRIDQYALGCLVFELLTEQVPFPRESSLAVFFAHVHSAPPDVCDLRPDLPRQLNAVFARVLAKNPDDRYPDCQSFAADIAALAAASDAAGSEATHPVSPRVPSPLGPAGPVPGPEGAAGVRPGRQRRWVALAVAALVAVTGGIAAWRLTGSGRDGGAGAASGVLRPSSVPGGVLRLGARLPCTSWDPQATAFGDCTVQRLLTRQLVTFRAEPGTDALVPDLAVALPDGSDESNWRYELKPGLTYDDGTLVTAADVKYGVERGFAPELGAAGNYYVADLLKGAQGYRGPYRDGPLPASSIETPDERTIVFHLVRPFGEWNDVLALTSTSPVPQAKDTRERYGARPLSSGPYRLAADHPADTTVLERNPRWDRATDPVRTALPDRIELRRFGDPTALANALKFGDVDADLSDVPDPNAAAQFKADPEVQQQGAGGLDAGRVGTFALAILPGSEPFRDPACRRAVAWAVDRSRLQSGGFLSTGALATRLLPPTLAAPDPSPLYTTARGSADVEQAKAALGACGRPGGISTALWSTTGDAKGATVLAEDLARAGIRVTIKQTGEGLPAAQEQGVGLYLSDFRYDWPSAYSLLAPLADQRSAISDPDSSGALAAGLDSSTEAARRLSLDRLDRQLREQAYYVPIVVDGYSSLYGGRLRNIFRSDYTGTMDVARLGVEVSSAPAS